jgi:hypothetical protein
MQRVTLGNWPSEACLIQFQLDANPAQGNDDVGAKKTLYLDASVSAVLAHLLLALLVAH